MTAEEYFKNLNPEIAEYFKIICPTRPKFIDKFIETPTMQRLAKVSYFCGMENGPKGVYNFKYYLSRLDHSISTALITWSFTYSPKSTLQALFHDANTPAFSHVIDYMNGDAVDQESTEKDLATFLKRDKELVRLLSLCNLTTEDLANFKENSIIDTKRPKLCADRLDSCFLTNLVWLQNTSIKEIRKLYNETYTCINEENQPEIGFYDLAAADRVVELQEFINAETHKQAEYDAMNILGQITARLIKLNIITYDQLFVFNDDFLFEIILKACYVDPEILVLYHQFMSLKMTNTKTTSPVKNMTIDPMVLGYRYSTH